MKIIQIKVKSNKIRRKSLKLINSINKNKN